MSFVNESDWIGLSIIGLTNITGSLFLSLLLILIFLVVICAGLKIPMEAIAILLIPLLLMTAVYSGQAIPVVVIFLIYMAIMYARSMLSQF
jgi:hypothetical protein